MLYCVDLIGNSLYEGEKDGLFLTPFSIDLYAISSCSKNYLIQQNTVIVLFLDLN